MHKDSLALYTSPMEQSPYPQSEGPGRGSAQGRVTRAAKRDRQRRIVELASTRRIANQAEFVTLLTAQGIEITQATVSRDITELGLVKIHVDGQHVYAPSGVVASAATNTSDTRLRRVLSDYPVRVGRSGLSLLLVSDAATAAAIAEAIDESTFVTQEGTLAGDNTVLVLFADEARLEAWQSRFETLVASVEPPR